VVGFKQCLTVGRRPNALVEKSHLGIEHMNPPKIQVSTLRPDRVFVEQIFQISGIFNGIGMVNSMAEL
jgi:hypothetical protein